MGDNQMNFPALTQPKETIFKPRICFFDRKNCSACGKCQKTYYCDSFLDRVNTVGLPPLMDTRNCTGCGLCVQVCDKGALHLYHPNEFIILISSSEERQELLQSLEIPFLPYDPVNDLRRFSQSGLQRLSVCVGDDSASLNTQLQAAVTEIWNIRLKDPFILGDNKSDYYKDDREGRRRDCESVSADLIGKLQKKPNLHGKRALTRAVIWSQLIWSDPGQVLWDSFLLAVQTYLESKKSDDVWEVVETADLHELQPSRFQKGQEYRISSYIVLLRQGAILLAQTLPSASFQFADEIFMDSSTLVAAYNAQEMGKNRLAGLDIRSCGHFLVKDFDKKKNADRLAMAGLPWPQICELLSKKGCGGHIDDFNEMCKAMAKRNKEKSGRT